MGVVQEPLDVRSRTCSVVKLMTGSEGSWMIVVVFFGLIPRDPITERQRMIGVYNHLRNAGYLGSITILRR